MSISHLTSPSSHPSVVLDRIPKVVADLRARFDAGVTRPLAWRIRQLEGISRMVEQRERDILDALLADLGRCELEAYTTEPYLVQSEIKHMLKHLPEWLEPEKVKTQLITKPSRAEIRRDPLGVALIIGPFNYPFQLLIAPLLGAIAGGNCALLKPSEMAQHTSSLLAKLLPRYVDDSCIQVVEGGVPETTKILEQRFDHIFYTGNGRVGRIIMAAAAKHLTPVTLELGGKSPCIVDRTANLDVAVKRIAWGKFINAGQTCLAPDYALVEEPIYEAFLNKLKATIRRFYGEDPQKSPDLARIINERHHDRLVALLADNEVEIGGQHDRSDRYIAPTVLRDVAEDAAIMQEEIFGPILPVLKVPDMEAAIDFCNRRDKPLGLYIFSEDRRTQDRLAHRIYAGGVVVNHIHLHFAEPGLPFGGVGESGMGSYHGRFSFETFTHAKAVMNRATQLDPPLLYPPYSRQKLKWIRRLG